MIYPVLHKFYSSDPQYCYVHQYIANATKLAIRIWEITDVDDVTTTVEETMVTSALLGEDPSLFEYKGRYWKLVAERILDAETASVSMKLNKLTTFLVGQTRGHTISYASNIDPRAETVYVANEIMYSSYFGLTPMIIAYPHTLDQPLDQCAYMLSSETEESLITNLPVSHLFSPEEQEAQIKTTDYMDIVSSYCVPEVQSTTVKQGESFELTLSLWSFDHNANSIRQKTFESAKPDSAVNRQAFITVICNGYNNITYAVDIQDGIGSVSIPTSMYKAGDAITFDCGMKIPPSIEKLKVVLN